MEGPRLRFHFVASCAKKIVVTAPDTIPMIVATSFSVSLSRGGAFLGTITNAPGSGVGSHHMLFTDLTFPLGWITFTRPLSEVSVYPPACSM